jgi:uncharacterized protein YndB with AHSA1/START domain
MSTVRHHVNASPAAVFDVLAEGWFYSEWVVGTSHVRAVERDWPAAGSRLFHATGVWPAVFRDETQVEVCEPGTRLVLTARGRPLGEATVDITLRAEGAGTEVVLVETPVSGPGKWLNNPLVEAGIHRRNTEALARLAALVERRSAI